jgi:hypothetical protein
MPLKVRHPEHAAQLPLQSYVPEYADPLTPHGLPAFAVQQQSNWVE